MFMTYYANYMKHEKSQFKFMIWNFSTEKLLGEEYKRAMKVFTDLLINSTEHL